MFGTAAATLEFAACKGLHLAFALGLPWLSLDVAVVQLLAGYVVAIGAASAIFMVLNVGNHFSESAAFIVPDDEGRIDHDWATHQVLTAVDWAPESAVAMAFTGGANAHAAHHLFPGAAHCHNARLSRLVSDCAARQGVWHNVLTFRGMLGSHVRHLWRLSRPPRRGDRATTS